MTSKKQPLQQQKQPPNQLSMIQSTNSSKYSRLVSPKCSKCLATSQDQLKALQKSCRQVEKKTRVKKKRPQESMTLSAELSKFLSQKKDVQMTKADVMKQISGYIKKENLQTPERQAQVPSKQGIAKALVLRQQRLRT